MKYKRIVSCIACLLLLAGLAGCTKRESSMPFNGEITFHQIKLMIPGNFIRDSTQSTDDLWLFEQGWYKKTIVLLHRTVQEDPQTYISTYAQGLQDQGISSEVTTFMGVPAAKSAATRENGVFWQELSFATDGAFYAVALNGGTEAEFQSLLDSIKTLS